VVALHGAAARPTVEDLLAAGCAGCVDKSAPSEVLLSTMRSVLAEASYLSHPAPGVSGKKAIPPSTKEQPAAAENDRCSALTPRQIEVLALAARGECNKMIARQLNISEGTVKIHLTSIYKALKVRSRSQATNIAMRHPAVTDERVRRAFGGEISMSRLMP